MKQVWVVGHNIVSPLGMTSDVNFIAVANQKSGLSQFHDRAISAIPIWAGKVETQTHSGHTRFEQMCLDAVLPVAHDKHLNAERTLLILSTTKGNVNHIEANHPRISLHDTANYIATQLGLIHAMVISNACISGVMAITVASRFLRAGKYDHVVIIGADELTSFVVSGFQSLAALSDEVCKPFDASRKGINLGEGAASILLTTRPENFNIPSQLQVLGSGLTNDSNHISGPSRTGEELAFAIQSALRESKVTTNEVDFISAHGTATIYNDEMEAKAFSISKLEETPLNSLKPFYGHTLGAAGVIETCIAMQSLINNVLVPTLGYREHGVSRPLNVIKETAKTPLHTFLKTASGFGGCNAAIVIQKVN